MIYLLIRIDGDIEDKDKIVDLLTEGDENGTTPNDYGSQYFDTKLAVVKELMNCTHSYCRRINHHQHHAPVPDDWLSKPCYLED
jgi:hypothetical protein